MTNCIKTGELTSAWSAEDSRRAAKRGWCLSLRNGYWQIEKFDVGSAFESDIAAQAFVKRHTTDSFLGVDSDLFEKAWRLHATKVESKEVRIRQFLNGESAEYAKHGAIVPIDCITTHKLIYLLQTARALLSEES